MLAAGVLGTTAFSLKRVMRGGAGAVVTKSIGMTPLEGYHGPVIVETPAGYLNALGLPNPGLHFLSELEDLQAVADRTPVIVSIFGSCADEFVQLAQAMCKYADAIELNLSCPHARGYGLEVGSDPAIVESITNCVTDAVELPVWVKLTPNVADITTLGQAAENGGADAVVAINTVKGMAIDVQSGRPILANKFGGLSGGAIRPIAVKCVYDLYSVLNIPIVGVGGITQYEDALEFIMAGAHAIQIGSGVANEPTIFEHVSRGISEHLKRNSTTLEDIIGIAHGR
ncbi:MAG: dihydroorotate dehydrogenase [Euryarchaeota archaeon]|nr:dihydroorotate dehydrogenase [Euryarchaeota archaeon]